MKKEISIPQGTKATMYQDGSNFTCKTNAWKMNEKLKKIGKELEFLREKQGITGYSTLKSLKIPSHVIKSVTEGSKNYTIITLLKLLAEVGKTIKIVEKD